MKKLLNAIIATCFLASSSNSFAIQNFYGKAVLGHSKITNSTLNKNFNMGLGFGYYVLENLRTDLTFEHFGNLIYKNKTVKAQANTILVNVFFDAIDISLLKIFFGAGAGAGKMKAWNKSNNNRKAKNNFAYALYLGTSTEFIPNIHAELVYSYRDMGKVIGTQFRDHNISIGLRYDF